MVYNGQSQSNRLQNTEKPNNIQQYRQLQNYHFNSSVVAENQRPYYGPSSHYFQGRYQRKNGEGIDQKPFYRSDDLTQSWNRPKSWNQNTHLPRNQPHNQYGRSIANDGCSSQSSNLNFDNKSTSYINRPERRWDQEPYKNVLQRSDNTKRLHTVNPNNDLKISNQEAARRHQSLKRSNSANLSQLKNRNEDYFSKEKYKRIATYADRPGSIVDDSFRSVPASRPNSQLIIPKRQLDDTSRKISFKIHKKENGFERKASAHSPLPLADPKLLQKLKKLQTIVLRSYEFLDPYERQRQVGEGTYGKVFKAVNRTTGTVVALKRIKIEGEKDGFPITAVREIRLLQTLRHPNVVSLLEMMVQENSIYMIFEYMDHDLAGILSNCEVVFAEENVKYLLLKLFQGLDFLHSNGVLHRDIKGSNILIDKEGELKLADFGLARFVDERNFQADYTNRVITLWYRPPELLLGATIYGPEIDIWSTGCLAIELFTRKPLFPGQNELEELQLIFNSLGSCDFLTKLPWYSIINIKPCKDSPTIDKDFNNKLTIDQLVFIKDLLKMDPTKRPNARQAIQNSYFSNEPLPKRAVLDIKGEWHEFESKRKR